MPSEGRRPRHQIPTLDTQCSTATPNTGLQHSILDLDTPFWYQPTPPFCNTPLWHTPSWHFQWRAVFGSPVRLRVRHQRNIYQNTIWRPVTLFLLAACVCGSPARALGRRPLLSFTSVEWVWYDKSISDNPPWLLNLAKACGVREGSWRGQR
jgi:hypothetical protein